MVYLSDIMQKRIKGWIAILVILLLAIVAAWAIAGRAAGRNKGGAAASLFFGGQIQAVIPCGPSGCPPCRPAQTMVKLKKETAGNGFPLFCYSPTSSIFVGPPPAPGINVLGFGPQISPILFYTSR